MQAGFGWGQVPEPHGLVQLKSLPVTRQSGAHLVFAAGSPEAGQGLAPEVHGFLQPSASQQVPATEHGAPAALQ